MKVARLLEQKRIVVEEVKEPSCTEGDVLIRVEYAAICRTDAKMYASGQKDLTLPRVMGHEFTGVVASVGKCVNSLKGGDRVQIWPAVPCGRCTYCLSGHHHLCDTLQIIGFHLDGGFAEYVIIPQNGVNAGAINILPDTLSFEKATFAEPLACCINAFLKPDQIIGKTVLIWGGGPIGHLCCQLATHMGAQHVILVEKSEKRRAYADNLDIQTQLNPDTDNVVDAVMDISCGRGVDFAIPACASVDAVKTMPKLVCRKGMFVAFSGLPSTLSHSALDYNTLHYREIAVAGAYGCSPWHNKLALKLLSGEKIHVDYMISDKMSLDELEKGLIKVWQSEAMKVTVHIGTH